MNKHEEYGRQVQLLLRIMPLIYRIDDFAVHGGTAINLFHRNMPRYSVDIDITFIPLAGRDESLMAINQHLTELKTRIERTIPGIRVTHKPDAWKLICLHQGVTVKIEVNGTKRGLLGETETKRLHQYVLEGLSANDRQFLLSFEQGEPNWSLCAAGDLSKYPSVQWKLQNLAKLRQQNPTKLQTEVEKLSLGILSR